MSSLSITTVSGHGCTLRVPRGCWSGHLVPALAQAQSHSRTWYTLESKERCTQEAPWVPDVLVLVTLFFGEPGGKRRMKRKLPFLPLPWQKFSKAWFPSVKRE